jgi:hypothetical protein
LSARVSLVCGFAVPAEDFCVVLRHAIPVVIHERDSILRLGITLISSFAPPADRYRVILRHSVAVVVHSAKFVLRLRVTLFSARPTEARLLCQLPFNNFLPLRSPADSRC